MSNPSDSELTKRRWIVPVDQVEAVAAAARKRLSKASTSQQKHLAGLALTAAPCPLCRFPLVPAVAAVAGESIYGSDQAKNITPAHGAVSDCGSSFRCSL